MPPTESPETRYARNGPVSLAYQVDGDGPIDVLLLAGGVSHIDYARQYPAASGRRSTPRPSPLALAPTGLARVTRQATGEP